MPEIYFIIVTYNAMKWAEKCFTSLRQSSVPVHCIVVDNGSTDGTQKFITSNFPEVELIQSEKNLGFGKANNIGIEKAYQKGADFFYLMNQDAWIFNDSVEKLLNVYNLHPDKKEIGILSPMHIDGTGNKLDIFLDKYIAHNFETRLISDLYFQTLQPFYEISFINAAHWFLPKETIEIIGGFNPYFFHYGEDLEYVNRILFHKKKTFLVPESKVTHDGKQSLSKVDYTKYEDLRIETNIMNPSIPDSLKAEKKALKQSMLKNMFLGKKNHYQKLASKYKKIVSEEKKLTELRNTVAKKAPSFLNL